MAHKKHFINGKSAAYPVVAEFDVLAEGLTKREAFAMAAMQGLCANPSYMTGDWIRIVSKESVAMADALLKELEK